MNGHLKISFMSSILFIVKATLLVFDEKVLHYRMFSNKYFVVGGVITDVYLYSKLAQTPTQPQFLCLPAGVDQEPLPVGPVETRKPGLDLGRAITAGPGPQSSGLRPCREGRATR